MARISELSNRERRLLLDSQARVDELFDEWESEVDDLEAELAALAVDDDDDRLLVLIALFLSSARDIVQRGTYGLAVVGGEMLASTWPNKSIQAGTSSVISETAVFLTNRITSSVEQSAQMARTLSALSGQSAAQIAASMVLTVGEQNSLRKAIRSGFQRSLEHGVYIAARNSSFSNKEAVAVKDSNTTNLCLDRMDGQVVAIDAYFVDPDTGASWLHSPFIYGGLPADEAYHECRTRIRYIP